MSNRIMLDLETMGNGSNAAIVSIGAVRFDFRLGVTDRFEIGVDLTASIESGGVVDGSTVVWWLGQPKEAQSRLLALKRVHVAVALQEFCNWATEGGSRPIDEIWGNGATADNVWLANAYKRSALPVPWTYKADRCYRTVRALYPQVPHPPRVSVEHDALADAEHQALHLLAVEGFMGRGGTAPAAAAGIVPCFEETPGDASCPSAKTST